MLRNMKFLFLGMFLVLFSQTCSINSARAGNLTLKSGSYLCVTATLMPGQIVLPTDISEVARKGANEGLDIKQQRPLSPQQFMLVPAPFGRIILDGKGNYQMPSIRQAGRYGFNASTGRPTFTGDLGAMIQQYYDGKGTSFNLASGELKFSCALQGPSSSGPTAALPKQRVESLGPLLTKTNVQSFSGRFQGAYVCGGTENAMTLEMLANAEGRLAAIMTFGGVRNLPRGSFKLLGNWSGSQFRLTGTEWIEQLPNYIMVDIEGEVRTGGVAGKIPTQSCSNFVASRVAR
jgi:hypothetical protein